MTALPRVSEITLESRTPAPLANGGYSDLVKAIPLLAHYCYFCNANAVNPDLVSLTDAPHWVPADVFESLHGEPLGRGNAKVYTSAANALADLYAVWAEVRGGIAIDRLADDGCPHA